MGDPVCSGWTEDKPKTWSEVRSLGQVVVENSCLLLELFLLCRQPGDRDCWGVSVFFVHVTVVIFPWQHRALSYTLAPEQQEKKLNFICYFSAEHSPQSRNPRTVCFVVIWGWSWDNKSPSRPPTHSWLSCKTWRRSKEEREPKGAAYSRHIKCNFSRGKRQIASSTLEL